MGLPSSGLGDLTLSGCLCSVLPAEDSAQVLALGKGQGLLSTGNRVIYALSDSLHLMSSGLRKVFDEGQVAATTFLGST